jgi:hypothetical protein
MFELLHRREAGHGGVYDHIRGSLHMMAALSWVLLLCEHNAQIPYCMRIEEQWMYRLHCCGMFYLRIQITKQTE